MSVLISDTANVDNLPEEKLFAVLNNFFKRDLWPKHFENCSSALFSIAGEVWMVTLTWTAGDFTDLRNREQSVCKVFPTLIIYVAAAYSKSAKLTCQKFAQ